MLPLLISLLYTISIIIATFMLITYSSSLKRYKFLIITLMWTYSLWKWLLLKLPAIQMMAWTINFWDALLFGLISFSFIVLPFFTLVEKYIVEKWLSKKDENKIFVLFILFLIMHSIPEAVQIGYQYTFTSNWTLWEVLKAIIEEIPEFIMLLSIYIIISSNKIKATILGFITGLLFPVTTLFVSVFATSANEKLEVLTQNILLWFYIIFWIMSLNLILKYRKKYAVLFVFIIVLIATYRTIVWI